MKGEGGTAWRVTAQVKDAVDEVETEVEVLVWADIVKASMGQGIAATYLQLARTVRVYLVSGAIFRIARLRKGPAVAALYPIVGLLLQLAAALGVAAGMWRLVAPVLGPAPAILLAVSAAWGVLVLFRKLDGRFYVYYLMHDYAFTAANAGAMPERLRPRVAEFADRIAAALRQDWDEVLVVGHSSGAHLAVSALARLFRDGSGQDGAGQGGAVLSLLTLGHVVPMVSFLPGASDLRGDLALVSRSARLTWIDVTAPGDGCTFALCDPVAVTGVADGDRRWPLVLSAAFSRSLSRARWKSLRWRFFRLHFQYLCAFDALPGFPDDYDYFAVTAGDLTLAGRLGQRKPSPSRIETPMSGYRDVPGVA